jgi:hypothetical protein
MSPIKKQTTRVLFSLSFSWFPSMSLDIILFLSHVFIVLFVTPLHSLTLSHSPKFCFTISVPLSISHSFNKGRKYVWEGKVVDEAKMVEKEVRIWWFLSTTIQGKHIPKSLKANPTNTPTIMYVLFFWKFRV